VSYQNLGQFVLDKTNTYGDKAAFILKSRNGVRKNVSYREFNSIVQKLAVWLRHQFPNKGFKVGLLGENRVEWSALALATWCAGGTIVPLSHIATDAEIQNICDAARLNILFQSPKCEKTHPQRVTRIVSMDFVRSAGGPLKTVGDILEDLILKKVPPSFVQQKVSDLAVLIFTSGTTGRPKGVMLTHANIKTNIMDVINLIPGDTGDRAVSILPLSHMFELTGGFLTCHMKGICISYPDSLKPDDVLSELRVHKATMLVAVPLFFEIIDRAIRDKMAQLPMAAQVFMTAMREICTEFPSMGRFVFRRIHDVLGGHMRYFVTGGARISPEVIQRFTSYGIQMYQGYGLTETSPILTCTSPRSNRIGSVGKPVHSVRIKLEGTNEKGEGEIVVSGPNVFTGYFEDQEATRQVLRDGWFYTGDIGRFDKARFLYITGRKKDLIVTPNGKNIYPDEIETILAESPYFAEVAIIGLDTARGESVHAVVVANNKVPGGSEEKNFVWREIERLSESLADYKRPSGVTVFRTELPKTSTRKVRKHILKEMIAQGEKSNDEVVGADKTLLLEQDAKEKWLAEKLRAISKKDEIWYEASLRHDLGMDSLTFLELVSNIETTWGMRVPEEDFQKIEKVSDVIVRLGSAVPVPEAGSEKPTRSRRDVAIEFDFKSNNSWWMNALRWLFHVLILRPLLYGPFRLQVVNGQILESFNNVVVTPNHSSHLDFPAVVASVPLKKINQFYAVAAADYFFNTPLKAFAVRLFFNCIPFDRKLRVEKGFKICEDILAAGGSLIIFPEGTRSTTGDINTFKPGVGRLLAGQKYYAVPVYLEGMHEAFPKGSNIPRPRPIAVHVGTPVQFAEIESTLQGYRVVAQELEYAVRNVESGAKGEGQLVKI